MTLVAGAREAIDPPERGLTLRDAFRSRDE
jgi:hypothetical protein